MKCRIMLHFIRVFTVCQSTPLEVSSIQRVNVFIKRISEAFHQEELIRGDIAIGEFEYRGGLDLAILEYSAHARTAT